MNYSKLKKEELIKKCKELTSKVEELKALETNEKLMIEESPDSIIYLDDNLKIVYINKQASMLLDYNSKDISGKPINILSNKYNIEEKFNEKCEDCNSIEFVAVKSDKSSFYCEMKMSELLNSKDEIYGYMAIIRDITALIQAKKELEDSENKYRTIIENSNDNIIITKNGRIEYINASVEKTTNYNREDVIGTKFTNYITKTDRGKVLDFHNRRINGDESLPNIYETIIIDKFGKRINIEINNNVLELKGEKCIISFLRDITERKTNELKKEKSYQEKLNYQQGAMDLTLEGIAILDKDKKYNYINDSYVKINGFDNQKEFENKDWTMVYSDKEISKINKSLNGDSAWIGNIKGTHKNGSLYDQGVSISILDDGGLIIVIRDITKFLDKGRQLKKAKEKAEEADNLKSAFLANMSHELRTPINSIQGFADIISDDKRNLSRKQIKKFTSTIKRRTEELVTLISDILDISRIEAGQVSITDSRFSLNSIIDDIEFIFKEKIKIKDKNVKIKSHKIFSNDNDLIVTDQTRLKQIITNLIDNAVKFTENGEIEYGYTVKNNDILEFYVKDTGIGMNKKDLELIFQRFRQVTNDKTYGGTGLGLTISKSLVELMGGKIWVQSEIGKGTIFFFTIPSKSTIKQSYFKNLENQEKKNILNINWSNKTILFVEDDEDNINLMKVFLKPTKVKLIVCKDGLSAEQKFIIHKDKIDLILMDIRLPKQDGLVTTKNIKKIKESVPIIAQTAYAMKGDEEKMKFYGCDDYITKPINESLLLNKIEYYLHLNLNESHKNRIFNIFRKKTK
jgi:PAS domain S-box-containing protein